MKPKKAKDVLKAAPTKAKIVHMGRETNSTMGNPRFRVTFDNGHQALTEPNAGWAYGLHEGMIGKHAKYTVNNKGHIDRMDVEHK